jgi:hypothetical protein
MSDRPAPDADAIRTWLVEVETPLGDLRRSLGCLLAITTRRGHPLVDPEALAWLVYQVQDNADAIRDEWAALWKLVFGCDPVGAGDLADAED